MYEPVQAIDRAVWREVGTSRGLRLIPEETPIALTYNGGTYAVMMGTPQDLEDFAVGFSLNEGVITSACDILSLEVVRLGMGIELRMWLAPENAERISERRRQIAGPTGCGLCGIDSIREAVRPAAWVPQERVFTPDEVMAVVEGMAPLQEMNRQTRAVHAAAFWSALPGVIALREDVGRHNALDKLAGALARRGIAARDGMVLVTSRVSVEMVQKTAAVGAPMLVAVSAPTALAIRTADAAGITLVAIARSDGFEVFTHADRLSPCTGTDIADVA